MHSYASFKSQILLIFWNFPYVTMILMIHVPGVLYVIAQNVLVSQLFLFLTLTSRLAA